MNVENLNSETKTYLFKHYATCKGRTDIYIAFLEKTLSLLKNNALCSFIIPYAFTNQNYGSLLRKLLIDKYFVREILDTSEYYVFENAVVKNIILSVQASENKKNTTIKIAKSDNDFQQNIFQTSALNQVTFNDLKDFRFETKNIAYALKIKEKIIEASTPLEDICLVAYGARLNHKTERIGKEKFIFSAQKSDYKPFAEGKNIERYSFLQYGWLDYQPKEHYNPMFRELFENEKIVTINVVKNRLRFAFDNQKFYNSHTVINCVKWNLLPECKHITVRRNISDSKILNGKMYNYKYLLGILNSKLMSWYFANFLSESLHFYPEDAKQLPMKFADNQQPIISLVEQILHAKEQNSQADTSELENKIDKLVCELYGLTSEEQKRCFSDN